MNTPLKHTPSPGFEFPSDVRDAVDQQLREAVAERQPARSVRRNQQVLMTPVHDLNPEPQPASHTTPMVDPEAISIDLPSKFAYYTFKDLYVKPFRLSHLAKVSKSHETASMQTLAEVVSSVLSTPTGEENIAFKLSMADFTAVLYWLRLNSFTKKQMRIEHECQDPNHVKMVKAGAKSISSLKVTTIYSASDIQTNYLTPPDHNKYKVFVEGYGEVGMRPETVQDVVEFVDDENWTDPEFQYKARVASVLNLPLRLQKKVELLDKLSPDDGLLALEFADLMDQYGIEETVQTRCTECGASTAVKVAVDALAFLSPQF